MIKLAEKIIDDKDISSLVDWLNSGDRYTKGEQTVAFEEEWSTLGLEENILFL